MTAQLQPINLVAPGFRGLNLSQAGGIISPAYAIQAQNCLIDTEGRLAARQGFSDLTPTDITGTPDIKTIFEYRKKDSTSELIVSWDGGISNDISDPEGNDISGTITSDANGRWWFQNFNDNVYGFQQGQVPIVYTGTGNFADLTAASGTLPTSTRGIALAAYGRLWVLDSDKQTIKYSALLSATEWSSSHGGGSIDMTSVWTEGMDKVTAIVAFNGQLVVFGERHIVFWSDGAGGQLGIVPDDMYVNDVITGTGCVSQWTIQPVGDTDLLFLGRNGIQSLRRVVQTESNPLFSITKHVRNDIIANMNRIVDKDSISSTFNPLYGFYLITIPAQEVPKVTGVTYCIDQRYPYQDDDGNTLNVVTTWTLTPASWLTREGDLSTYLGGSWGVGDYGEGATDNGASYRFIYTSPWLELGEQFADRLKMLKRVGAILNVENSADLVFKWSTDFDINNLRTKTVAVEGDANSEWGTAEWGLSEWSGGLSLRIIKIPSRGKGQYFRLGLEAEITGTLAIQQLELFTKIGRLA